MQREFPFLQSFLKNNLFGVYLIYGVMLVSAVKQSESVTHIHTPLFWTSSPFRSPQSIGQSSLCKTVGSLQLSILYVVSAVVYLSAPISQFCLLQASVASHCHSFHRTIQEDGEKKGKNKCKFLTFFLCHEFLFQLFQQELRDFP